MKKAAFFSAICFLIFSCSSINNEEKIFTGKALGTTYQIKYFSKTHFDFQKSLDSIFEHINSSMSTYRDNSDISKINSGDSTVVVDQNFITVLRASKKVYNESKGYFDPTVGNLVNAYGFGPKASLKQIDSSQLDSLVLLTGLDKVNLKSDHTISKENPGIYLDFNAIAKGYTIDVIAEFLDAKRVNNYLIELGGELRASGKNQENKKYWLVGIDDPFQKEAERAITKVLKLKNRSMATSGNYRKFREDSATGQKYVHTVNPLTGKAEKSNLLSASVLAENCMLADAYATAFMAMGFEKSLAMQKMLFNVDIFLIYSEKGESKTYSSKGFKESFVE